MNRIAAVTSIIFGTLISLFSILLAIGMLTSDYFSPPALPTILVTGSSWLIYPCTMLGMGILGTAGGICGILGGAIAFASVTAARRLMLAAAICTLPIAFLLFFLFMAARNKLAAAWSDQ